MDNFLTHACEQVLRFTKVKTWEDLSEERKVQLGFNMGVIAHSLNLTKEEGFQALTNMQNGVISMKKFREHIKSLVTSHDIEIDNENISRPF